MSTEPLLELRRKELTELKVVIEYRNGAFKERWHASKQVRADFSGTASDVLRQILIVQRSRRRTIALGDSG